MGIFKTLDRALAVGMAVGALPAVGLIATTVGTLTIVRQIENGKLGEEDLMLIRISAATLRCVTQVHKASLQNGFIHAMLDPAVQRENARISMEMAAEIHQLSAEDKAATMEALKEVLDKSNFGLAWILKDSWRLHERVATIVHPS